MKKHEKRDKLGRYSLTHAKSNTREYSSWMSMKRRCYYKKAPNYSRYGARGITVCDRWLNSFENFLEDMGERPEGKTIDKINNDGNYEPDNCRWATSKEQKNNQNVKINTKASSGVVGVYWNKVVKKWYAGIGVNKKLIWLGKFDTKEEAIKTRKEAERKYYATSI